MQLAITFASADAELANQIGEMLRQLEYIDDCDTFGQKAGHQNIHKVSSSQSFLISSNSLQILVLVYEKILEFYQTAVEILNSKGTKRIMGLVLESDRLPNIIQDFLRHSDTLAKLINQASAQIVQELKDMLYDSESKVYILCGPVA